MIALYPFALELRQKMIALHPFARTLTHLTVENVYVPQPHQPLLEPCEDGMGDLPSRKDANSIAQRVRAQWRQSYPKPASAGTDS
jgi:hypothetical protein